MSGEYAFIIDEEISLWRVSSIYGDYIFSLSNTIRSFIT